MMNKATCFLLAIMGLAIGWPIAALAQTSSGAVMAENTSDVRVRMSFNNQEVIIKMHDNPTSRDFISLLPLTLSLEDYQRTEKISYLPRKLTTKDAPGGIDPSVGDFTYYAPWGNLAIFYRDFGYSGGLITLGRIESGIEKLADSHGKFKATLEVVK